MSDLISKIELKLWTGRQVGTGDAYLALGGREYCVDSDTAANDPRSGLATYVFGEDANVKNPEFNDPRRPWPTNAADITRLPMYLRFAPRGSDDNWHLERVDLGVWFQGNEPGAIRQKIQTSRLSSGSHLWLGLRGGLFLFFDLSG